MTARWLRGTVFATLLVVLAAAAALALDKQRLVRALAVRTSAIDEAAQRALTTAYDVRASQQGYVAAAQSPEWWHGRLASQVAALRADLAVLRQLATDPGALNDLDAAAASLDTFVEIDERAMRLVLAGSHADASLLIFSDGLEAITTMLQRVDSARTAEARAADAQGAVEHSTQGYAAAGGAAGAVLASLFLLATGPARPRTAFASSLDVDIAQTSVSAEPVPPAEPAAEAAGPTAPLPSSSDPPRGAELHEAASLCTDFARVIDAHELPGLLARAAGLIEARGLVVWLADPDRSVLRPSLAHGYSAAALARLSSIDREADNATAACFRRAEPAAVAGDATAAGAVVAPLLTASGCVGVLTAEVLNGRETSGQTLAMVRILAAQIAMLVGGGPAREEIAPGQQAAG